MGSGSEEFSILRPKITNNAKTAEKTDNNLIVAAKDCFLAAINALLTAIIIRAIKATDEIRARSSQIKPSGNTQIASSSILVESQYLFIA